MRPKILLLLKDDRVFVLEICRSQSTALGSGEEPRGEWSVVTRRNEFDYPPVRVDPFPSYAEALAYYRKVVVETPRVSLDEKSPEPPPSLDAYQAWLIAKGLYDPVLNPTVPVKNRH